MGILFISHSNVDNEAALRVRDWLKDHGWGQVFLDLDATQGLAPGHRWQQELKSAGERCSGVVVLISPNWVASRWCQTEFLVADQLGKKIFPVFVAPTPFDDLPLELKGKFQLADVSTPEKEADGFERLAMGLKRSGLDPKSFPWPPPNEPYRPIYRGLQSLDSQDAAIFFGRDAPITKGVDAIRRMRDGAGERVLVVLGASGAGKSSYLKAGLVARLSRDEENFLVLPVIRPGRAAMTGRHGLTASLECNSNTLTGANDLTAIFAMRRELVVERLKRLADASRESYTASPPTIVIAVDQAEELLTAQNDEAARVLELLAASLRADANAILILTIRSDVFAKLQCEPRLEGIPLQPFSLPPMPLGAFKEVIEGPARLAEPPLAVEPALSDRLLHDLAAQDALPLLAFTLERLSSRHRGGGMLTLAEYVDELGGLQGAIVGAVEVAFAQARRDPALPRGHAELEKLARSAFIPALVQLDDVDAEPRRRVERLSALPQATHPLVRLLIDQRLLVSSKGIYDDIEADIVEVAHEAILRQWPALRNWIAEERDTLRALNAVRVAAAEWRTHVDHQNGEGSRGWLAHRGGRLEEAEALMARPDFTAAFSSVELDYLAACRTNEDIERQRELRSLTRTRRLQRGIGVLIAVAAAVVLLAGFGIVRLIAGMSARISDTLAAQAAKESNMGNYERGARYALAGLAVPGPFIGDYGVQAEAELVGAENSASHALAVLRGHGDQVLGAAFSPDGKRIVTASRDKTVRIWEASTGRQIAVLRGHRREVTSAAFSPNGRRIVTASGDKTARIWDANSGREIAVLRGHDDGVVSAAFSPDGRRVITASGDKTARIWDAATMRTLVVLRGHTDQVESAAFSPDGKLVVTGSDDKTARIWDAGTGREIRALRGHEGTVDGAVFSPEGKRIVTASEDKTARIWDVDSGDKIKSLQGHESAVTGVSFSPDGTRVVSSSRDGTARIWDASTAREIVALRGHDLAINSAAFSPDGARVVTASDDETARIWDATASHQIVVLHGDDIANNAAFSPDGTRIVTASNDKTAQIWNAVTGDRTAVLHGHEDIVETAAFSPDGRRIVTASDDKTARIWDANTGREATILRGHEDAVLSAAFSPDGRLVVTASRDKTARTWDAGTGREIRVLRGHKSAVGSATFSADGLKIVTASGDGTARIWDTGAGRLVVVLHGHESALSSAAFSFDGGRVVIAYRDKTAEVWDVNTAQRIAVLRGHEDAVLSAVFTRDGNRIVTASRDGTARIWDANTAREIAVLRGHEGSVNSADVAPDGGRIVTASDDDTARIWNISAIHSMPRDDLVRRTCELVLRNGLSEFSAEELRAAPVLDPQVDADACHPLGSWARLGRIFRAGLSR